MGSDTENDDEEESQDEEDEGEDDAGPDTKLPTGSEMESDTDDEEEKSQDEDEDEDDDEEDDEEEEASDKIDETVNVPPLVGDKPEELVRIPNPPVGLTQDSDLSQASQETVVDKSQGSQLSHLSSQDMFSSTPVLLPGATAKGTKEEKKRTANRRKKAEKKKGDEAASQGNPENKA